MFAGYAVRSRTLRRQTEGIESRTDGLFSAFNLAACLCFEHGRERASTSKILGRPFSLIESCLSVPSLLGILPHAAASDLQHSPILASFRKMRMLGYWALCTYFFFFFLRGQPLSANGRRGAGKTTIFDILGLGYCPRA
jgi:hypothetical protein